jgi:hypothetical protein
MKTSREVLDEFLLKVCDESSREKLILDLVRLQILTEGFDERYLINNTDKSFKDIQISEEAENNHIAYFSSEDGCPYRIELIEENSWRIKSFKFLCMGCFGEDSTCGVCGGSGWGVL